MTVQITGMLVDALDAIELAEIGVREVVADIDTKTGHTDRGLLVALENLAVASTLVATRRVVYERKQAEAKAAERDGREARRQASKDRGREIMERAGADDKAIEATLNSPGVAFQDRLHGATTSPEWARNYQPVYGGALATIPDDAERKPEPEHVTISQLAREIDVSDSQMHRWVRNGKIEVYKVPGKRARIIRPADVHLLRSVAATKPAGLTAAPWIGKALNRAGR